MKADHQHTKAIAAVIAERLAAVGLSEVAACRAAGLNPEAIRNIKRGHAPSAATAKALADVLGVTDLSGGKPVAVKLNGFHPAPGAGADSGDAVRLFRRDGARDDVVAMVPRPPDLFGRSAGYAVYVDDDRNAPWVRVGHIAFVDPSRPASMGSMVRVFPADGAPFLAVLMAKAGGVVSLTVAAQANPIEMAEADVTRMERVVGFTLLDG